MSKRPRLSVLTGLILCLVLAGIMVLINRYNAYAADANASSAELSLSPVSSSMPPNTNIKIVMKAATNISFVRVDIPIDTQKLQQSGEVLVTSTCFKALTPDDIADVTTSVTANQKGKITQIFTLKTSCVTSAPTGTYEIASIPLGLTQGYTAVNQNATLAVDPATIQVVDSVVVGTDQSGNPIYHYHTNTADPNSPDYLVLTTHPAVISINPELSPTPTLTVTPVATLTPVPTYSLTPTLTPTITPTAIPSPTQTPSPSATPTQIPTPTASPTPAPVAKLIISPAAEQQIVGAPLSFNVLLDTAGEVISGFAFRLTYPYSSQEPEVKVRSVQIAPLIGSSSDWSCPTNNFNYQSHAALIDVACSNLSDIGYQSSGATSVLQVTIEADTLPYLNPVFVSFDPSLSLVTRKSDNWNILMTPASTGVYTFTVASPSVVPTATPYPTVFPSLTPIPTFEPSLTVSPTPALSPTSTPEDENEDIIEKGRIDLSARRHWLFKRGEIDVVVSLHANVPVSAVNTWIKFDPQMLQVVKITDDKLKQGNSVSHSYDNDAGLIQLSQSNSEGFRKEGKIAVITFKVKGKGTTKINVQNGQDKVSRIISKNTGNNILQPPRSLKVRVRKLFSEIMISSTREDKENGQSDKIKPILDFLRGRK